MEVCDGEDNNCDQNIDEGLLQSWYADFDSDAYGDASTKVEACVAPAGYVTDGTDCDDTRASVYPGAVELCDGEDNNCDQQTDEGLEQSWYVDADNDGYGDPATGVTDCAAPTGYVADNTDCDDTLSPVNPGAEEACNDTIDNNCDGEINEAGAVGETSWYSDLDGDDYGDLTNSVLACDAPFDFVADATDCDDADVAINPAADDSDCDGVDDNCSGAADEDYQPVSLSCGEGVCGSFAPTQCENGQVTQPGCSAEPNPLPAPIVVSREVGGNRDTEDNFLEEWTDGDSGLLIGRAFPTHISRTPDGGYIYSDNDRVIRKVNTDGTVHNYLALDRGSETGSIYDTVFDHDVDPSTAMLPTFKHDRFTDLVVGPDCSIYVAVDQRIFRIHPDGDLEVYAGIDNETCARANDDDEPEEGFDAWCGDGLPATQAPMHIALEMDMGADGNLYVSGSNTGARRVRVIRPDGIIEAFAGNGQFYNKDGGRDPIDDSHPAVDTIMNARDLAVGPDGRVYITSEASTNHVVIRRVDPADGSIETIAGMKQNYDWDRDGHPDALPELLGTTPDLESGQCYRIDIGTSPAPKVCLDMPPRQSIFTNHSRLALDSLGRLYIQGYGLHRYSEDAQGNPNNIEFLIGLPGRRTRDDGEGGTEVYKIYAEDGTDGRGPHLEGSVYNTRVFDVLGDDSVVVSDNSIDRRMILRGTAP